MIKYNLGVGRDIIGGNFVHLDIAKRKWEGWTTAGTNPTLNDWFVSLYALLVVLCEVQNGTNL